MMTNDRSDAALRERLMIAEKAEQGPWKLDEVITRKKGFEPPMSSKTRMDSLSWMSFPLPHTGQLLSTSLPTPRML